MRRLTIVLLAGCLLAPNIVVGDESGGTAAAFLQRGAGARAIAMGGAFVAVADDASASCWNPAGLTRLETSELTAMHGALQADRSLNFIAGAHRLGPLTLGLSWLRFGVGDIQQRDDAGALLGYFEDAENAFMLSAGFSMIKRENLRLSVGITGKYLRHTLHDHAAGGRGVDVGGMVVWRPSRSAFMLAFGVAYQNLGAKMKWDTESDHEDDVPGTIRTGAAFNLGALPLEMSAELVRSEDQDPAVHLGGEYLVRMFALRLGLADSNITAGAGYTFRAKETNISIDYAYSDDDVSSNGMHLFSLGLEL